MSDRVVGDETVEEGALAALQEFVGGCREWVEEKANICGEPSEHVLWGKLIPADGLGPRCAEHAAEHVGWPALHEPSWAIVHLRLLAREVVPVSRVRVLEGELREARETLERLVRAVDARSSAEEQNDLGVLVDAANNLGRAMEDSRSALSSSVPREDK